MQVPTFEVNDSGELRPQHLVGISEVISGQAWHPERFDLGPEIGGRRGALVVVLGPARGKMR